MSSSVQENTATRASIFQSHHLTPPPRDNLTEDDYLYLLKCRLINENPTVFEDAFSEEVWASTYKDHNDETINDTIFRVAAAAASMEKTMDLRLEWTEKFYNLLSNFKGTCGGRIYANAGTQWGGTTLMNCFTGPRVKYDPDSLDGIFEHVRAQAHTLKSEGGWGENFSYLRPRGAFIDGIGVETPGAVKYMEIFDKVSDVITAGSGRKSVNTKAKGKIRKGAMMGVLDCLGGNTPINTLFGKVPIKELVGQTPYLYCTDGQGNVYVRQALMVWSKGIRATVKVVFNNDDYIECTPDHEFLLSDGLYKKAKDLIASDSLAALNKRLITNHKVVRVEESIEQEVFDIAMPEYHNFVANGVFIHNCWHPDIIEFITAKQQPGRLTKFNVSVNCTDDFMFRVLRVMEIDRLLADEMTFDHPNEKLVAELTTDRAQMDTWQLMFPNTKDPHYKGEWHGDLKDWRAKGYGVVVYATVSTMQLWDLIMQSTYNRAEPGVLFLDRANHFLPLSYAETVYATNPCLTGDTLVAVADGRHNVTIQQLAEEGKDVPVFCYNDQSEVDIRLMRHPRITGYDQDVYEVVFEDGSFARCTNNHKWRLTSGEYKQTKDLMAGDSIKTMHKFHAAWEDIYPNSNFSSQDYMWVNLGRVTKAEHRLIAEYATGQKVPVGHVVHHRDFNSLNNDPANLEIMSKQAHDEYHGSMIRGDNNPMRRAKANWTEEQWQQYRGVSSPSVLTNGENNSRYLGCTHDDIEDHATALTQQLGRRFSVNEWEQYAKEHNLPTQFSSWRVDAIGSVHELSIKCADRVGLDSEFTTLSPKQQKTYISLKDQKYDVIINNQNLFIRKECCQCGDKFEVHAHYREVGLCSIECSRAYTAHRNHSNKQKYSDLSKAAIDKITQDKREKQAIIYNNMKSTLKREPLKTEWQQECKQQNVACLIGPHSPHRSFADLKEYASNQNHRVVEVRYVGKQNVYNGTVDNFHNFFVCIQETQTRNGKKKWTYINNLQCGEQTLAPGGVCNLGSLNLTQFVIEDGFDLAKIAQYTGYMVRFLDNINDLTKAPLSEYEWSIQNKRRIGVGILGWGSALYMLKTKFASKNADRYRDEVMRTVAQSAYMASIDLAQEKGMFSLCDPDKHMQGVFIRSLDLPQEYWEKLNNYGIRNSSLLSIQPTGNTSIFANVVSGGLEPVFLHEYVRTVIVGTMPEYIADVTPKWFEGAWHETSMFKFTKEGDEEILRGVAPDGLVYKIDKNRGLTKEVLCEDYGVRVMKRKKQWNSNASWAATALSLNVKDHVNDLKGFARWVDSAMSKCVAEGTLISTNKGLKPVEALGIHNPSQEGFVVPCDSFTVLDENGQEKAITRHYFGGVKPCATVRFDNGFEITAAYTHKLKCATGWKSLDDIEVGDKVFYRTNAFVVERGYVSPPQPTFAANAKHRKFPQVVDEDFALLLGMWVADGSLTDHSIAICEKNEKVSALCERLMLQLFNTHHVQTDDRWGVNTHYVHSNSIARWFKQEFGHGAANKHLPQWLLDSPVSIWKAFIEGLTLDGYLKTNEYGASLVVFDGYAKDVAEKVTHMLSSMGVQYSLCTRNVGEGKTTYGVTAWLEDMDTIVPIEDHKMIYTVQGKTQKQTYISNDVFEQLIAQQPSNTYGSMVRARLRKCQQRGNFVRMSFIEKTGLKFDRHLTSVVVTDIRSAGLKNVYDIEVEDTHSYLINGIVSHNTVNVPNEYPFEQFKSIYTDAFASGYVKGVTTYRAGTMTTVLAAKDEKTATDADEEIILEDVKLPDSAPATMKTLKAEGRKWYLTVLWWDDQKLRPFGFFVHTNSYEKTVTSNDAVEVLTALACSKGIPKKHIDETLEKIAVDNNTTKVARMISLNLRHGVLIKNIVAALDRVQDVFVGTFLFQIKKYLSSFIKDGEAAEGVTCGDCGSTLVVYSEGCHKCTNCGSSKCG